MADTHDYDTIEIIPTMLNTSHTLVGQCGGLSSVIGDVSMSNVAFGMLMVETEHGTLYLDPDEDVEVLDQEQMQTKIV